MAFSLNSSLDILVALLLFGSLLLTLYRVKVRLFADNPARSLGVAVLNVIAVLTLAAWLSSMTVRTINDQHVLVVTDKVESPNTASFDARYDWQNNTNTDMLYTTHPGLASVTIEGYGLHKSAWQGFDGLTVNYTPPVVMSGLVDMSWQRKILLGNQLNVAGRYHSDSGLEDIVTVQLLDLTDSIVMQTKVINQEAFALSATPKAIGHYQYRLKVISAKGQVLNNELLPVVVGQAPVAKIMVMQSAPSFESKHLKNWAAQQGASLLLLTAISKDRYLTQSVNLANQLANDFSPANLKAFDLLIIDARALSNLSQPQQQWLNQAVEQGLGVMVLADTTLMSGHQRPPLLSSFNWSAAKQPMTRSHMTIPQWSGNQSDLTFDYLPYNLIDEDVDVLLQGSQQQNLSVYQSKGLGKVALSLLKDRYRWLLNGDRQTYSQYWQRLLSQLARGRDDSRFIAPKTSALTLQNIKTQVCVMSPIDSLQVTIFDEGAWQPLWLSVDSLNPFRHCSAYWPTNTGWQSLQLVDAKGQILDSSDEYVFSSEQWQSWQQQNRVAATHAYLNSQRQNNETDLSASWYDKKINQSIYWWLLTLCACLLWLERKGSSI